MKPDSKLQTQRPTKFPIRRRDKLKKLFEDSKKREKKQIGPTPHEKHSHVTTSLNPLKNLKKNDSIRNVSYSRQLN